MGYLCATLKLRLRQEADSGVDPRRRKSVLEKGRWPPEGWQGLSSEHAQGTAGATLSPQGTLRVPGVPARGHGSRERAPF